MIEKLFNGLSNCMSIPKDCKNCSYEDCPELFVISARLRDDIYSFLKSQLEDSKTTITFESYSPTCAKCGAPYVPEGVYCYKCGRKFARKDEV